jgi:hypothetical protein
MIHKPYIKNKLYKGFLRSLIILLFSIYPIKRVLAEKSSSLFESDELLRLELRADFNAIEKGRTEDPEYFDGELIWFSSNDIPEKFNVKVMVRGHFRRDPEICSFPPLLVNFKEKEVQNTIFDKQNKLKLVTPCQNEEYVVEEYLLYKMYNEVTDISLKVRPAKILYYDTGTGKKLFEKFSFFIEDKGEMAERNDAETIDKFLTPFDLNRENFKKMALFEYLIGNKDWYITSRKNVIILKPHDLSQKLLAVPFDFDLSGIIDVSYSKPEGVPEYALADKRIYKGLCYTDDEFSETFNYFRKLKPVFENIINSQDYIPKYSKKKLTRYIAEFYTVIENNKLFQREFLSVCQTQKDYNLSGL